MIDVDSGFCPACGSIGPFADHCPACSRIIDRGSRICPGCGRGLFITCPECKGGTFVGDRCDSCGVCLVIRCPNPRCAAPQFFENEVCRVCGGKIKKKHRAIGVKGKNDFFR